MKMRDMTLLVRVAETGSMTLAAQQLHLTPAAVSAAVQRIEDTLGIRVFERTTRSLHPTDEGLVVIEGCVDVIDRWQRALDDARGQRAELEGTIHLAAPTDTTYSVLQEIIVQMCEQHPKLRIVLNTSDTVQHLHREAIDMAIRYGTLTDSTLSTRRLSNGPRLLVASPDYLSRWGTPTHPTELTEHRCLTLQLSNTPTVSWRFHRGEEIIPVTIESPLCCDGYLARRWAVAGMGLAFKNIFDVIDDLEEGSLVRVLPEWDGGRVSISALFPSRRFLPARVRALAEVITARFTARAERCDAWLETQPR